mgnify:FL=1
MGAWSTKYVLEHINIHMIMQTCTETMISLVIEEKDAHVLDQLTDYTVSIRKGTSCTIVNDTNIKSLVGEKNIVVTKKTT